MRQERRGTHKWRLRIAAGILEPKESFGRKDMKGSIKLGRRPLLTVLAALGMPASARAQAFPAGRVSFVVPFPPGASTDISTRIVADKLSQLWGHPVLIDNKGGANGIIAAEAVMRAKPDGYTILATSSMTHAGNPSLYEKLSYDAIKDFEPITRFSMVPMVVLVHKGLGVTSLAELTAKLKAEPGKHAFGAGAGSARVAAELYKMLIGSDALFVGYKNNQQAIGDIQSGRLSFMIIDLVGAKGMADNGYAKALAVTQPSRVLSMPDLPTTAEAGLPALVFTTWSGFYAPKGTPREIVLKLNKDIIAAGNSPETAAKLDALGGSRDFTTPEEFADFTKSEIEAWGKVIRAANIRAE
jgi:tripartite-type tricarboxylate transporter receptor subunit TctC